MKPAEHVIRWRIRPALFVLCALPLVWTAVQALGPGLGTNPIEELTHRSGDWTLRLLLITLAVTPLRHATGWHWLVRLRRMLGLFSFFYASLHLTTYLWLDQFFIWPEILTDVVKRPFITVGFAAFVLMLPLAATSTDGMMRWLGRRWTQLHRLVYAVAVLGVLHYWWLVKADVREPAIYAALLAVLLGVRALRWRRRRAGPGRRAREGVAPG
jgi:sulfoxide reductase heme-binding subunit YedZ